MQSKKPKLCVLSEASFLTEEENNRKKNEMSHLEQADPTSIKVSHT